MRVRSTAATAGTRPVGARRRAPGGPRRGRGRRRSAGTRPGAGRSPTGCGRGSADVAGRDGDVVVDMMVSAMEWSFDVALGRPFDPRSGDLGVALGSIVVDRAAHGLVGEDHDDLDLPASRILRDEGLDRDRLVAAPSRSGRAPIGRQGRRVKARIRSPNVHPQCAVLIVPDGGPDTDGRVGWQRFPDQRRTVAAPVPLLEEQPSTFGTDERQEPEFAAPAESPPASPPESTRRPLRQSSGVDRQR